MKNVATNALSAAVILAATSMVAPVSAAPGVIDRACRQSNRADASPQLCGCIQKVANQSLNMRERRKVAKWFNNPHLAQKVRQSDRRRDEILWERYKAFGEQARQVCS